MKIRTAKITATTQGFCDIIDITAQVTARIQADNIARGVVILFVSGSTAALTTIEHEPGLIQDLKELLERLTPAAGRYHHNDRWGDDNGFSHLRAALFGPSLQVPIVDGRLVLGTWQQIVLLDFDNRKRTREIVVQVIGETE